MNVTAQQRDPDSLLNWIRRLIRVRQQCPEVGWGRYVTLETAEPSVLMHRCEWEDGAVLVMHNLADKPVTVGVDLDERAGECLIDLLGDKSGECVTRTREIDLPGYGSRWFRFGGRRWKRPS